MALRWHVRPISEDMSMSVQQSTSRNTDVVETHVSIIGLVVGVFQPYVAKFDASEWFVILQRAELHNEGVDTEVFVTNNQSCHDHAMSG